MGAAELRAVSSLRYDAPPRIRLFGGIRVADEPVQARQLVRRAFALLALNIGKVVTLDELIREAYGEALVPTSKTQVQIHLSLLREATDLDITTIAMRRRASGYRLEGEADDVDVLRFRRLTYRMQDYLRSNQLSQAEQALNEALALHTGEFLDDVESGDVLEGWHVRVQDALRTAQLRRIDFIIRNGGHEDVVDELRAMCFQDPFREDIVLLLMLALYRSLRRDEALKVYANTCRLLADELGVEPSPPLVDLHRDIIRGDRALFEGGRAG